MKRRSALQSLISLPALTALPAAGQQKTPAEVKPAPVPEFPKLATTRPDFVAPPVIRFFQAGQFRTLTRLAAVLMPAHGGRPGAVEAGVPEFLDFLLSESPPDRQLLYREGLDALEARQFAEMTPAQVRTVLAPLETPWTYAEPSDPLARFLRAAKEDILHATLNSREWSQPVPGRRSSGLGTYWFHLE